MSAATYCVLALCWELSWALYIYFLFPYLTRLMMLSLFYNQGSGASERLVCPRTQLVNGETRIETQDSGSRAHALAQETMLPGMFSYIPAHGSPTHRSKPSFNAHSSLIITTRNLCSLLPICLQHLAGTSLSLKKCCFVLVAVDTGGFSLLPGCLLLYR